MRARVICTYCGLPFTTRAKVVGPVYCCTGCAMASRIPVDASGQFPINRALIELLAFGFGLFNEILFALLALLLAGEGKGVNSVRFAWASVVLGVIVLTSALVLQRRSGGRTGMASTVGLLSVGVAGAAFLTYPPNPWLVLAGNGLLILWSARGIIFGRNRTPKKRG